MNRVVSKDLEIADSINDRRQEFLDLVLSFGNKRSENLVADIEIELSKEDYETKDIRKMVYESSNDLSLISEKFTAKHLRLADYSISELYRAFLKHHEGWSAPEYQGDVELEHKNMHNFIYNVVKDFEFPPNGDLYQRASVLVFMTKELLLLNERGIFRANPYAFRSFVENYTELADVVIHESIAEMNNHGDIVQSSVAQICIANRRIIEMVAQSSDVVLD